MTRETSLIHCRSFPVASSTVPEVRPHDQAVARTSNPVDSRERSEDHTESAAVARVPGEALFLQVSPSRFGPDFCQV